MFLWCGDVGDHLAPPRMALEGGRLVVAVAEPFYLCLICPDDAAARAWALMMSFDPAALEPAVQRDDGHINPPGQLGQLPLVRAQAIT